MTRLPRSRWRRWSKRAWPRPPSTPKRPPKSRRTAPPSGPPRLAPAQGQARVMQFLPNALEIKVGDSVKWINYSTGEPHTVTFVGEGETPPEDIMPGAFADGSPKFAINPMTLFPQGGDSFDGTGYLNSGYFGLPGTADRIHRHLYRPGRVHLLLHPARRRRRRRHGRHPARRRVVAQTRTLQTGRETSLGPFHLSSSRACRGTSRCLQPARRRNALPITLPAAVPC